MNRELKWLSHFILWWHDFFLQLISCQLTLLSLMSTFIGQISWLCHQSIPSVVLRIKTIISLIIPLPPHFRLQKKNTLKWVYNQPWGIAYFCNNETDLTSFANLVLKLWKSQWSKLYWMENFQENKCILKSQPFFKSCQFIRNYSYTTNFWVSRWLLKRHYLTQKLSTWMTFVCADILLILCRAQTNFLLTWMTLQKLDIFHKFFIPEKVIHIGCLVQTDNITKSSDQ